MNKEQELKTQLSIKHDRIDQTEKPRAASPNTIEQSPKPLLFRSFSIVKLGSETHNNQQSTLFALHKISSPMSSSSLILIGGIFVVCALAAYLFASRRRGNNRSSIQQDAKPVPSAPGATFIHQVRPTTDNSFFFFFSLELIGSCIVNCATMGRDGTVRRAS